jgi:hypothetical protein
MPRPAAHPHSWNGHTCSCSQQFLCACTYLQSALKICRILVHAPGPTHRRRNPQRGQAGTGAGKLPPGATRGANCRHSTLDPVHPATICTAHTLRCAGTRCLRTLLILERPGLCCGMRLDWWPVVSRYPSTLHSRFTRTHSHTLQCTMRVMTTLRSCRVLPAGPRGWPSACHCRSPTPSRSATRHGTARTGQEASLLNLPAWS